MKELAEEQKALKKINESSRKMEAGQKSRQAEAQRLDMELDHVPTRDNSSRRQRSEKKTPLTYDTSRVKSSIPSVASIPKQKRTM